MKLISVTRLLDGMSEVPALVMNRYRDVVACNRAMQALVHGTARPVRGGSCNVVAYVLSPAWRARVAQSEQHARAVVGGLRITLASVLAERPGDTRANELLATLTRRSADFPRWWSEHELWDASRPVVHVYDGLLSLEASFLGFAAPSELTLIAYGPIDSASAQRLRMLVAPPSIDPSGRRGWPSGSARA